jgi:alpha-1,3-rhamnosyl/mannosyltransferase
MRLILGVDAIFPPLTGIGRYAFELATRLPAVEGIEQVRYLGLWGWTALPQRPTPQDAAASLVAPPWYAAIRRDMARRTWAVNLYDTVSEAWRRRLLRGEHTAVFHSPNYFLPPYDGPCVATVHDLSIYRFPATHLPAARRYFELAFERSLRRAHMVITDSEAIRQELIAEFSVPPDRVRAIPLGVDPAFRPRSEPELLPVLSRYGLRAGRYCLSVATLEPRKKLDRLIAAYEQLDETLRRSCPLVLIGAAGWLQSPIMAAIERGRAQGWLRYLGYVSQADLPAVYAGARGLAMISIYEGFGLPVLEAMASGVPVLTSNVSSLPEVAGGAALLANSDDPASVSELLQQLLTDDSGRTQAIEAGLRRAQQLTWERCLRLTVDAYQHAVGGGG